MVRASMRNGDRISRAPARSESIHHVPLTDALSMVVLYLTFIVGDNTFADVAPVLPEIEVRWLGVGVGLALSAASALNRSALKLSAWQALAVIWAGYLLFSTLWAPIGETSYRSAASELAWLLVMIILAVTVVGSCAQASRIYLWWCAYYVGVLFAVASLAAGAGSQGRFSAFGGGPNTFVRIVFIGIVAALVLAIARNSLLVLFPLPILVAAVILSGSRGGMIASVVAVLVLAFCLRRRIKLWAGAVATVAVAAGMSFLAFGTTLGATARDVVSQRILTDTLENGNVSGRSGLYAEAFRLFLENPLLGVGAGGFAKVQTILTVDSHPHSIILSSLSEGGIVGGLFIGALLAAAIPALAIRREDEILKVGAAIGAVFVVVASQFSGYYFDFRLFFLFLVLSATSVLDTRSVARSEG